MTTSDLPDAEAALLERARLLARRGWGWVHPNPLVGCVIARDGEVVGEGWHASFGGPHAEVEALQAAGARARGATAFVSLEPCRHQGKTPPCTAALVRAGVARVVFGAADPGAESGGGGEELARAGIDVVGPVFDRLTARAENPSFFHAQSHAGPYVALKLALSLDGRIAAAPGARTAVTGSAADREVHRLRSGFDAVMVGIGTADVDDPRLTVRHVPRGRVTPARVVLDPAARLSPSAALFGDVADAPLHVFTGCDVRGAAAAALEAAGAAIQRVPRGPAGLDLDEVMSRCADLGFRSILCEGGARVGAALLAGGYARRLYLFVAPRALGEQGVAAFGPGAASLPWDRFGASSAPELHGEDVLLVYDRVD